MASARDDAADPHLAGELRIERVADVILAEIARTPASDIEEAVVHREIDIGHQRRHRLEAFQHRRQQIGIGGLGGNLDDLLHRPSVAVAIPGPDRGREVLQADHAIDEAIGLGRVMRRPELEHELIIGTEIDLLEMLALLQVPEMQPPSVLRAEENFRHQPVLDVVRRAPFAGHGGVVAEVPPEIVGETLRAALDLPAPQHVEGLRIHEEHAARRVAFRVSERRDIDAVGPAMDCMRAAIAGRLDHLFRLDHPHDHRVLRVGLGVDDVDARGAQARHHEIAPLGMRMRRVGAEARAACVPAVMVQLIAGLRHVDAADDLRIGGRGGVDIDHGDGIRHVALRRKGCHISERFCRRLSREPRRGIEGRVWRPSRHRACSFCPRKAHIRRPACRGQERGSPNRARALCAPLP